MAIRYFDRLAGAGFGTLTGAWDTTSAFWNADSTGTAAAATFTFTDADEAQFGATGTTATAGTATVAAGLNVTLNRLVTQNLGAIQSYAGGSGSSITFAGTDPELRTDSVNQARFNSTLPIIAANGLIVSGSGEMRILSDCPGVTGAVTVTGVLNLGADNSGLCNQFRNVTAYHVTQLIRWCGTTAFTENALLTGTSNALLTSRYNPAGVTLANVDPSFAGRFFASGNPISDSTLITNSLPPLVGLQYNSDKTGTNAGTIIIRVNNAISSSCSGNSFLTSSGSSSTAIVWVLETNAPSSILTEFTGNFTKQNHATTGTFRLTGTNDSSRITGNITALGGTVILQKQGTGKWTLSGVNTYTGTTTISAGTLSAQNASALGRDSSLSGGAISVTGGTLELSGGITLDKSGLNISTVTTASPTNAFQVPASGGDNTLEVGSITLNSTIRTEVGSGGVLRLANTGAISGSTFGITKEGAGELDLNAASNTFTGAVSVNAGTLTVSASCAPSTNGPLGNASSAVVVTGTLKFDGASNSDITRSVQLAGSTPALDASGTHRVHFHAVSQASGSRTLTLRGTSTATNQLQSALGNGSGGTLSLTKEGAGQWLVTGTPTYTGATTVNAGTLDFGGQTLSLSGGVAMAGGTLANGNIGDTLVSAVTFTGGTVIALLDSTSTVTASSGTGRLQPLTADGSNSYTGNTTVQSGATLELVTDANPGVVGDGKVTGASNVTVSGTLATGSGVNQRGQARYGGNLTFAAGSVLAIGAAA